MYIRRGVIGIVSAVLIFSISAISAAGAAASEICDIRNADNWRIPGREDGVEVEHLEFCPEAEGGCIRIASTIRGGVANYQYKKSFGKNVSIRVRMKHSTRMVINFGPYEYFWGSPHKFIFRLGLTANNLNLQGNGVERSVYKNARLWLLRPVTDTFVVLEISVADGILNARYNGAPLAYGIKLSDLGEENYISFATWAVDELIINELNISDKPADLSIDPLGIVL